MLPHLVHDSQVLGGALLVTDRLDPLLGLEQFSEPALRGRARLSPELAETRAGKRVRRRASSAEGIRALKRSLGVPCRPTNDPVDLWARN